MGPVYPVSSSSTASEPVVNAALTVFRSGDQVGSRRLGFVARMNGFTATLVVDMALMTCACRPWKFSGPNTGAEAGPCIIEIHPGIVLGAAVLFLPRSKP